MRAVRSLCTGLKSSRRALDSVREWSVSGTLHVRRRIRVDASVRITPQRGDERQVLLVALSSESALLIVDEPLAEIGETLELYLPTLAGKEIPLLGSVDRIERIYEGIVMTVQFMVGEASVRRDVDALLTLLLGGDGGGLREHPRVSYGMPITLGEPPFKGELLDLSMGGLSLVTDGPVAVGERLRVRIPHPSGHRHLVLLGLTVSRKPDPKGARVGVRFDPLPDDVRAELSAALSELLRR